MSKGTAKLPNDMKLEPPWRERGDCGPLSLYVLMRLQGHQVSIADIKKVLRFDPEAGCSLADIARAADALGFPTEIRFVNPRDFSKLQCPFILHSEGSLETGIGHFLVVVSYSPEEPKYSVIDTTYESLRSQTEESLLRDVTGYVLLPKNDAVSLERRLAGFGLICVGCAVVGITIRSFAKKRHLSGSNLVP